MRIALVSDFYLPRLGGIEMHVHDLALQLRLAGHATAVFTATPGTPPGSDDVPVVRYPAIAGLPSPGAVADLRRTLTSGMYDVVHVHTSLYSPLAWHAARAASRSGVPTVITMHSLPAAGAVTPPQVLAQVDRGLDARVEWTAVSQAAADSLQRTLPGRQVRVLHNGIDPGPWQRPASSAAERPLTIVSTMRLAHRKRPAALLRTLQAVRRQVPLEIPLRAVVAGAGPRAGALARAVERRDLASWVELPGRLTRPQLQELYARADVYLAPAELESFGVAALEARCAGLAVVAMASGGVGEFVRHGVEGFLVGNDVGMVRYATGLLTTPGLLHRIQQHNRATAPAMTWDAVIGHHLRIYRHVCPELAPAPTQELS